ncbi:hypothetical protein RUM43_002481 [Polyplax serrata]|uniref:Uncharacterized protein n=1 Tax=Polyplax serrata TaxID=468196 RepID=A0AAN8NZ92_POLSC
MECNIPYSMVEFDYYFTSVNNFQDEVKFSPSFYNLAAATLMRPPPYELGNFQTPTKSHQSVVPSENYYAATDIVKVFPVGSPETAGSNMAEPSHFSTL